MAIFAAVEKNKLAIFLLILAISSIIILNQNLVDKDSKDKIEYSTPFGCIKGSLTIEEYKSSIDFRREVGFPVYQTCN